MSENWILDANQTRHTNPSQNSTARPKSVTGCDEFVTSTPSNPSHLNTLFTPQTSLLCDECDEFSRKKYIYKNSTVKAQVKDKEYKYIRNNYKNPSHPSRPDPNYPENPDNSNPQHVGKTDWFKPDPYPYQIIGAIQAAQGKTLIADEPGLGKTIQAILWAAITKPKRLLVICPPNLATNWNQEITRTGITKNAIRGTLLQIKPTKKHLLSQKRE